MSHGWRTAGRLWRLWGRLLGEGPVVGWALVGLGLTLFFVGFAIVAAPRARTRRGRIAALGPAVGVTSLSLMGLAYLVGESRDQHLAELLSGPGYGALPLAEHLWLGAFIPGLALAVPGVLWAIARTRSSRALGIAATLLTALAAIGGAIALADFQRTWLGSCLCLDLSPMTIAAHTSDDLDQLTVFVIVAAILSWLGTLFFRHRARRAFCARAHVGAVVVFALGALMFARTRGHASDRHEVVELSQGVVQDKLPAVPDELVGSCDVLSYWVPRLEVNKSGTRAWLDGRVMDPERLARDLDTLRRNWALLRPGDVFLGKLLLSVPASAPMSAISPWLRVVEQAHYDRARFTFVEPRWVTTRVLGRIEFRERCVVDVAIDVRGDELPQTVEGLLRERVRSRRVRRSASSAGEDRPAPDSVSVASSGTAY